MLIPLTAADVPDFRRACAYEHVFGSRALTVLRAYGLGDSNARFFLYRAGSEPVAALSLLRGVLSISSSEQADPLPISELAKRENVCEIHTNAAQCAALQRLLGGTSDSSYYMVYRGGPQTERTADFARGDFHTVFDILQRSHEYYRLHLSFDTWSANLQRSLSCGLSEVYQLELDGAAVGTGCILSQDDTCGVLGAIAVVPEHRHKGLGSRISRFLVQRVQEMGKTPRLIAGYDAVAELYRRIGFAPCGRWGELYL